MMDVHQLAVGFPAALCVCVCVLADRENVLFSNRLNPSICENVTRTSHGEEPETRNQQVSGHQGRNRLLKNLRVL